MPGYTYSLPPCMLEGRLKDMMGLRFETVMGAT